MGEGIQFVVPGKPVPKGRPRMVRGRIFTPAKTKRAENAFAAQARRFAPPQPLGGSVAIRIDYFFPIPPSWPKWKREAAIEGLLRHTSKPDLDNLIKLTKDAMTQAGFWKDDAQVDVCRCSKSYALQPRTMVHLVPIAQPQLKAAK